MASSAPLRPPLRQEKQETSTSQERCAMQVCRPGLWETRKVSANSARPNVTGREQTDRRRIVRNSRADWRVEVQQEWQKREETL